MLVLLQVVVGELAGRPVENGGNGASGRDDDAVVGNGQVALRGDAALGFGAAMRLVHEELACLVVGPERFAGIGVERMEVDAVARPDARREVDDVVENDRAAARRPLRGQALVADHHLIGRAAAMFPELAAVGQLQGVKPTVIAADEDAVFPANRGEADGSPGVEGPADGP